MVISQPTLLVTHRNVWDFFKPFMTESLLKTASRPNSRRVQEANTNPDGQSSAERQQNPFNQDHLFCCQCLANNHSFLPFDPEVNLADIPTSAFHRCQVRNILNTPFSLSFLLLSHAGEDVTLVPPDDIWWVWYLHILATRQYREDCLRLTGNLTKPRATKDRCFNQLLPNLLGTKCKFSHLCQI